MKNTIIGLIALLVLSSVYFACKNDKPVGPTTPPAAPAILPEHQVSIPMFSPDTAYAFVAKQIKFGPRVPNTPAHKACAAWFASTFASYGLNVIEQKFTARGYTGVDYAGINVIGQYKPEQKRRIMLAAHWDSRFMADRDTKNKQKPIAGADDGASGVGVLLEIARILQAHPIDMGVDFVLFDAEDQGLDSDDTEDHRKTWCLGSQYWSNNMHAPQYTPHSAILLDMVGAKGATFKKEGISRQVAPLVVNKIWDLANSLGYGNYFINEEAAGITDDHYFVISNAKIPMIDIINMKGTGEKTFDFYHHTHADNMDVIDKNTLKAVGQVVTAYIYRTYNGNI